VLSKRLPVVSRPSEEAPWKDTNGSEDWRVLCELASKEKDPEKLIDLITKINQALEEFRHKSRSPLNANAYLYNIAPVISQPVQYDC
jgi:hypothetical protein